jgi:hypothetical protein
MMGEALRIDLLRLLIKTANFVIERLPMPQRWRASIFERAHAWLVSQTRLEWIRDHCAPGAPAATPTR